MEKAIVWYKLWLKLYIKRSSTWIFLSAMGLLLWMLTLIDLPDTNFRVGICYPEGDYGSRLEEELKKENSIFRFESYEDEEQLYEDVIKGRLECGFWFKEDFQEKMERGTIRGSIICLSTPFGYKSKVAQETLYAHLLKVYSGEILAEGEERIFGQEDPARTGQLLKREEEYRMSQKVFHLRILELEKQEETGQKREKPLYPLQAVGGLLVFTYIFLAQGRKFHRGEGKVEKAMRPKDSFLFGLMRNLGAGTLPTAVLLLLLQILDASRGWIREGGMLLLFLVISSLWSRLAGYFFKKETTLVAVAFGLALLHLFVCPILIDLSSVVPAMKQVSLVFPLGIYLLG